MANVSKVVGSAAKPPNAGKGRVKGVPNKTTVVMKEAITSVYADLQKGAGGKNAHFKAWAENNQTEFYKIAAKLIPLQVEGGGEGSSPIAFTLIRQPDAS
jgi:hypothetical protein